MQAVEVLSSSDCYRVAAPQLSNVRHIATATDISRAASVRLPHGMTPTKSTVSTLCYVLVGGLLA